MSAMSEMHRQTEARSERIRDAAPEMLKALKAAQMFIRNGRELGFIRMPDPETPDPAHLTPTLIDRAIDLAEKGP